MQQWLWNHEPGPHQAEKRKSAKIAILSNTVAVVPGMSIDPIGCHLDLLRVQHHHPHLWLINSKK